VRGGAVGPLNDRDPFRRVPRVEINPEPPGPYRGIGVAERLRLFERRDAENEHPYGNSRTNAAWKKLLPDSPVQVGASSVKVGPGIGLPDCTVLDPRVLTEGDAGVLMTGFFGLDWSVESSEFVGY